MPRPSIGTVYRPSQGRGRRLATRPFGQELVLAGQEVLDGNRQVHVRPLAEPERGHADHRPRRVDERGAAEGRVVGRHDEGAVEHVFPGRGERAHRVDPARARAEPPIVRDTDRADDIPDRHLGRVAEGGHRPGARALELHHPHAHFEVECDQAGGHLAAVPERGLDPLGVEHDVAHGQHVAGRVEDDAAAPALDAEGQRRRAVAGHFHLQPHDGRLDPLHVGRQGRELPRIDARLGLARRRRQDGRRERGEDERGRARVIGTSQEPVGETRLER